MSGFEVKWGLRIPLRDGVHLNATAYLPAVGNETRPCIVTLTPYTADYDHERGTYFASHGLPFLIVDVRGRGGSEGTFHPMIQEAPDGYDIVEWAALQPWCNGRVGMWGGSYGGYSQWVTAKELPPHLVTIAPACAPFAGVDFPMRRNIFYPFLLRWLMLTSGPALQLRAFSDRRFWSQTYQNWYESGRPFRELDQVLGNPCPLLQQWLSHPEVDEYWDAYNPTAQEYARLTLPVLTITGSYDDDQPGALAHYREHMRNAPASARNAHYLVIGPWDHAGTFTPVVEFGGLKFGAASLIDIPNLHREWYRWTMEAGPRPAFLQKRVAYYVMGAEEWRYADTLEAVTREQRTLFLDSCGSANDIYASGLLTEQPSGSKPDSYTYDPGDARGAEWEAESSMPGGSLVDQRVTHAMAGRQLVYHSAPFDADTDICGFFRLIAWLAIDTPDTDFYVSIFEITAEGIPIRLSTDALRARYRNGSRSPQLIRTRDPLRYDFDAFTFVCRRIKRYHRLRLVISPVGRLVDAAFTQRNFNAGGVVAEESAADARPVTVRLFHDERHASALHIPLG